MDWCCSKSEVDEELDYERRRTQYQTRINSINHKAEYMNDTWPHNNTYPYRSQQTLPPYHSLSPTAHKTSIKISELRERNNHLREVM